MENEKVVIHLPSMNTFIADLKWKIKSIYQIWAFISILPIDSEFTSDSKVIKQNLMKEKANHSKALVNLIKTVSVTFSAELIVFKGFIEEFIFKNPRLKWHQQVKF